MIALRGSTSVSAVPVASHSGGASRLQS